MIATIDRFGSGCVLRIGTTEIEGLSNDTAQAIFEAVNFQVDSVIEEELRYLKAEVEQLERDIDHSGDQVSDLEAENSDLRFDIENRDEEIDKLKDIIGERDTEITELKLQIERMGGVIAELEAKIDQLNDDYLDLHNTITEDTE